MLKIKTIIRLNYGVTYLVLDVDSFAPRLKERESTVEDVRVDKSCDLVINQLDGYLLMDGLLEEQRVTVFEDVFYFNTDG